MADLMIAGTVQYMQSFKLHEPSPMLASYVQRCFARPAAQMAAQKEAAATAALA